MKRLFLSGIAALSVLYASAAHAREWQGNMPPPVGPLPPYPPVTCVTLDWRPESCESRRPVAPVTDKRPSTPNPNPESEWECNNYNNVKVAVKVTVDEATTPPSIQYAVTGLDTTTNYFRYVPSKDELYLNGRICTHKGRHKTVLYNEPGGLIADHVRRWQALAASGDKVEIRGVCPSACTLIMAYVPNDRLCFGEGASLQFHSAWDKPTGAPAEDTNQWVFNQYPQDIRRWIKAKGGLDKMTIAQMWTLDAAELWAMGYRKCEPEAPPG